MINARRIRKVAERTGNITLIGNKLMDQPQIINKSPGTGPANVELAEETQELKDTELERVRKTAENWRTGLAGILALITTVSVVKGRDTIIDLAFPWNVLVGALVLFALISAAVGAYYALRSAYGWPERVPAGQLRKWKYQRSEEAVADLGNARNLTFATLLFLALAIGITWYGPTDPPRLRQRRVGRSESVRQAYRL
jgi:hypothetical protein